MRWRCDTLPDRSKVQMIDDAAAPGDTQPQAGAGQAPTSAAQAQPTGGMARGGYLPPVAGFAVRRDDGGAVDPAEFAKLDYDLTLAPAPTLRNWIAQKAGRDWPV